VIPDIPGRVKALHAAGFGIAIFTNQNGIEKGYQTVEDLQFKVMKVCDELGVPVQVLMSVSKDDYRKPNLGMWKHFVEKISKGVELGTWLHFTIESPY
jgi:bifunctional polynucleotide phosphatase/kinase